MPPLLSLLGFLAWPLTIGGAVVVLGTSSETTLSLLHEALSAKPGSSSVIKASMPGPVIRMPSTPVISPELVRARITLLSSGRQYAAANAGPRLTAPGAGIAQLTAMSGLTVRSKPTKASAPVGSIAKGATVEVRSKQRGWLLVESADGISGWVFGKYLAATPQQAGAHASL
jgi:uncharacterized protein YgiM (DUF1202 family)